MPENPELLAAIVAHPREDTPRLAYADWLDDHGDTDRARFIRVQYEIEKLPPIGAKASKAKKEEEALLKKHETRWLGELAGLARKCIFRRGFVEVVRISAEQFLAHAGRLFELAPIRDVRIEGIGERMAELVASPHFGRAEALGFNSHIGDQLGELTRLTVLLASPKLATVCRLEWAMSSLKTGHIAHIAECPNLGSVVHIDLSSNPIGDVGVNVLAHSECLPALTSLRLWGGSYLTADGIRDLLDSPLADRLEHLVCAWLKIGDDIARAFAGAPKLKRLLTLDLSDNDITDAGAKALAASKHLGAMQRLTLRGHRKTLTATGRDALKARFGKDACVF